MLRFLVCLSALSFLSCTPNPSTNELVISPLPGNWLQVAIGVEHTCGIFTENASGSNDVGDVYCWGTFSDSMSSGKKSYPTPTLQKLESDKGSFKLITAGLDLTCALSATGELVCFGAGIQGVRRVPLPDADRSGGGWRSIQAGGKILVATTKSKNSYQIDLSQTIIDYTQIPGDWISLSVVDDKPSPCSEGKSNCLCGLGSDGSLRCTNSSLALAPDKWSQIGAGEKWAEVTIGSDFTCAKGETKNLVCCLGDNSKHQLGDGDKTAKSATPVFLAGPFANATWSQITSGFKHTCGIRSDDQAGSIWCWGDNSQGQLGIGNTNESKIPMKVAIDAKFILVRAGGNNTCAISTTNELYCWGMATSDQIGVNNWQGLQNCFQDQCIVPMQVAKPRIHCPLTSLPSGDYVKTCACNFSDGESGTCTLSCCCEADEAKANYGGRKTSFGNVLENQTFENINGAITLYKDGKAEARGSIGEQCTGYPCRRCGDQCCSPTGPFCTDLTTSGTCFTRSDCVWTSDNMCMLKCPNYGDEASCTGFPNSNRCTWVKAYWWWQRDYCKDK
jgi:hypothetical protein